MTVRDLDSINNELMDLVAKDNINMIQNQHSSKPGYDGNDGYEWRME